MDDIRAYVELCLFFSAEENDYRNAENSYPAKLKRFRILPRLWKKNSIGKPLKTEVFRGALQ